MPRGQWLDAHRLHVFRHVAQLGSIRRAAERLRLTPSTVSQLVNALESQVGLPLTDHVGRGIVLTPEGRELADRAGPALEAMSDLSSWVESRHARRVSALTITYIESVGALWLPAVTRRLLSEWPELRIELQLDDQADLGGHDPRITIVAQDADYEPPAGHVAELILTEGYAVLLPRQHPLTQQTDVRLGDVTPRSLIATDAPGTWCRDLLERTVARSRLPDVRWLRSADLATTEALVVAGLGIGVVPESASASATTRVVVRPLAEPGLRRSVHAVVRASDRGLPHVDAAIAALVDAADPR